MKKETTSAPAGKLAFTPGPWTYGNGIIVGGGRIVADYCASGQYDKPHLAENEANARLIAAAPSLLSALHALMQEAKYDDQNPALMAAFDMASAAIQKATSNA